MIVRIANIAMVSVIALIALVSLISMIYLVAGLPACKWVVVVAYHTRFDNQTGLIP